MRSEVSRSSKQILLSQEVGTQSLRILNLANGYDENAFLIYNLPTSLQN